MCRCLGKGVGGAVFRDDVGRKVSGSREWFITLRFQSAPRMSIQTMVVPYVGNLITSDVRYPGAFCFWLIFCNNGGAGACGGMVAALGLVGVGVASCLVCAPSQYGRPSVAHSAKDSSVRREPVIVIVIMPSPPQCA